MRPSEDQLKAWMIGGLDGDAASHAALLSAIAPMLRSFYARRLGQKGDEIEDLVQESLIAIHVRRASYDRDRLFSAWLFAIARYKMIDHFRRERRYEVVDGLDEILVQECFADTSDARIDVDRLLGMLPRKQAMAIRHTHLDGLDTSEAAAAANIGESDVKVSVHRGLKALAARLMGERR